MTQLYQHKFLKVFGNHIDENGYTKTFLERCYQLRDIDQAGWSRVRERIQSDIRQNALKHKESWPPNYLEILAYAEEPETDEWVNERMYKIFDNATAIEDKTAREKRMQLGREQTAKLFTILGEPESLAERLTDTSWAEY